MNEYLKPFTNLDKKMPLYVKLAGITYPDPTYRISRTDSKIAVVEYVTDGEGYISLGDKTHHIGKDTVYFLPPNERHSYSADKDNPYTKIFMNVSGSLCEHLIHVYGLSGNYIFDGKGLKPVFEKIVATIQSDMSDNEMQFILQGLFTEIISRLSVELDKNKYSDEALKLKKYLDSNPHRLVSAKELSKTIFRSQDYCQKLFYREFGITPYAYQLEQKMQTAKSLLTDTNMSIGEIAKKIGYTDIHYFSNLFLRKCNCRPSDYRKNKR